jgi:hypothetical protein
MHALPPAMFRDAPARIIAFNLPRHGLLHG